MTVKTLKNILDDHDDDMEVFVSIYHDHIGRSDSVEIIMVSGEFIEQEDDKIVDVLEISANMKHEDRPLI